MAPLWLAAVLLLMCPRFLLPPCPLSQLHLWPTDMSCSNQCQPCPPCGPTPLANSCNEPCVRQCQDSTVVIQPSPVVVTLPGPILSSEGVPISSGGFGLSGFGSRLCGRRCLPC